MHSYCNHLNNFTNLRNNFIHTSFKPDIKQCSKEIELSKLQATKLYNYTIENKDFINNMKNGCLLVGNLSHCHILNSGVDDILNAFNNSYYNYIQDPESLCTSFTEYSNNLEKLFITSGCYLNNMTYSKYICLDSKHIYKCY
jgi:hypothetical protein